MTLLASVASMFCSLSLSAASPAVAIVPAETVNRVEIISPAIESSAVLDSESLVAIDVGDIGDGADLTAEADDFTPDKFAADSNDEELLPADVVTFDEDLFPADGVADAEELLPADVVVEGEDFLPADVIVDGEELLPADVIADIDAGLEDVISEVEVGEGVALAEAAVQTTPAFDEDLQEDAAPTAPPAEEPVGKDDSSSGDGEAAS
jgi:hypothetical protein